MKKELIGLFMGAVIGLIPGAGALASQAPEILDPELPGLEWEDITPTMEDAAKIIGEWEINRTRSGDVIEHWWEIEGEIPDNAGIPDEVEVWAVVYGVEYDISPELICSIAWTESRFVADATNGQFTGIMQVGTKTHLQRIEDLGYTVDDMTDPRANIHVATDYLHELFQDTEDAAIVLMTYNGDSRGIVKYKRSGIASYYARSILERSARYEAENGKIK